jgi:hypothetical protein
MKTYIGSVVKNVAIWSVGKVNMLLTSTTIVLYN